MIEKPFLSRSQSYRVSIFTYTVFNPKNDVIFQYSSQKNISQLQTLIITATSRQDIKRVHERENAKLYAKLYRQILKISFASFFATMLNFPFSI